MHDDDHEKKGGGQIWVYLLLTFTRCLDWRAYDNLSLTHKRVSNTDIIKDQCNIFLRTLILLNIHLCNGSVTVPLTQNGRLSEQAN